MAAPVRRRTGLLALGAAVVALVLGAGAVPAQADVLHNVSKDLLRSSNGPALAHGWRDRRTYFDASAGHVRDAWTEGSYSVSWAAYELLSHGDVAYNYYYIQASVDNTLNRMDYPYRDVPASLRITANGTGVRVVQQSYTESATLGVHCTTLGTLALGVNIGFVAVGYGSADFQLCGGGTRIDANPSMYSTGQASTTWGINRFQNLRHAEFDYVVKVPATYKPNFRVDLATPYDYYNSYNAVVETFSTQGFDTRTNCRIGTRGCPAV